MRSYVYTGLPVALPVWYLYGTGYCAQGERAHIHVHSAELESLIEHSLSLYTPLSHTRAESYFRVNFQVPLSCELCVFRLDLFIIGWV